MVLFVFVLYLLRCLRVRCLMFVIVVWCLYVFVIACVVRFGLLLFWFAKHWLLCVVWCCFAWLFVIVLCAMCCFRCVACL